MTNYKKTITMEVEGLSEALKQIKWYEVSTHEKIDKIIADETKIIGRLSRQRVSVDSGRLKKSIKSRTYTDTRGISGLVASRERYAHLVEFGASAATIKPKKTQAMRIDEFGVRRFASGEIKIPARKPQPFMIPAYEQEKPEIERKIKQALREVKK